MVTNNSNTIFLSQVLQILRACTTHQSPVHFRVHFHQSPSNEFLLANVTLVRLFLRVCRPNVHLERRTLSKSLATVVTLVRLFLCVNHLVSPQQTATREAFATDLAAMRLDPSVDVLMVS